MKNRLHFLDGLRGWAAVVVLVFHTLSFLFGASSNFSPFVRFVADGRLAVFVFFVLSGFALTAKYAESGDRPEIPAAVVTRYFRLALPIFGTSLIAYLLMKLNLFKNLEVATLTKAHGWLDTFFVIEPSIWGLLKFSFWDVFFNYNHMESYNSSLWTMPVEFIGSIICFSIAVIFIPRRESFFLRGIVVTVSLLLGVYNVMLACFVFGYLLAEAHLRFGRSGNAFLERCAIFAFASVIATSSLAQPLSDHHRALMAVVLVSSVTLSARLRMVFESSLSVFLGRISFPLYLTHIAVICSFSSWIYLGCSTTSLSPLAINIVTASLTAIIALLVAYLSTPLETISIRFARKIGQKLAPKSLQTSVP